MSNDIYKEVFMRLDGYSRTNSEILNWGTPVLYFGDFFNSKIATLGINPSDKEFLDDSNNEILSSRRRFHTLKSLGIDNWLDINQEQMSAIESTWTNYFSNNPYNVWFKKLDFILSSTSKSYYFPSNEICHLDLVPFATKSKWGDLDRNLQEGLINDNSNLLGRMLSISNIEYLVLNGRSVVESFQKAAKIKLDSYYFNEIDIVRKQPHLPIKGVCFEGAIDKFADTKLPRSIKVLGYNHNIQSSFGISTIILKALRNWISIKIENEKYPTL